MSEGTQFPETRAKPAEQPADPRVNVLVLAADGRVPRNHTFVDGA